MYINLRHNLAIAAPSSTLQLSFSAPSFHRSDCPGAKVIRSHSGFHDNLPHVLTAYLGLPPPSDLTATIDNFQFQHQTSLIPNSNTLNTSDAAPWSTAARPFMAHPSPQLAPDCFIRVTPSCLGPSHTYRLCRRFLNLPSNQVMVPRRLPLGDLVIPEFYYCRRAPLCLEQAP
jgi:hypothetical protein